MIRQLGGAWIGVGKGGALPEGDDGVEGGSGGSPAALLVVDLGGKIGLSHTEADLFDGVVEGSGVGRYCSADSGEFRPVLNHALFFDVAAGWDEFDVQGELLGDGQ